MKAVVERADLQRLLDALDARGYEVVGPTVRDGAIVYESLRSVDQLPIGWTDEQEGGRYRIVRRSDQALFGFALGPHSWKKFLFPPTERLWRARRQGASFEIAPESTGSPRYAFLGVRACELQAISIQDKVFAQGAYVDKGYQERREGAFIIALNCGQAGGTCFCVSMGAGPQARAGFDLALTEILDPPRHYFVIEVGSERGGEVLQAIPHRATRPDDEERAERVVARTAGQMGRTMQAEGLKDLLYRNLDHPRWNEVAARCLSCANCTLVCPTCFCSTVEDTTDLTGEDAERWRKWDSCFTLDFSYVHGGSVRSSTRSRYRQWMTHKLATWHDQFGVSGCVGCGRCITWCPVAIDITEEVGAIRESEAGK